MERKPFPSETQERFIIRFPDGMRDRIKEAAEANNRSMNAEIVARLEGSFDPQTSTEPWSKEAVERFEMIAAKAGEAAATRVLQAQGLDALKMGVPGLVQTPPPPKAEK